MQVNEASGEVDPHMGWKTDSHNKVIITNSWVESDLTSYCSILAFLISFEMWNLLYQNNAPDIMIKSVT